MADGLPLDTESMSSGDPGAATALDLGKQTTESKNIPTITSSKDYEAIAHGSAYMDPEGKKRFKPIRNKEDYLGVEEGAEYADPSGQIRTKPRYEGIDFTPQTLYDIAHSDKGRKMALEKFYPGKVKEDPSGGFYIEDEGGKLRKPGRGATALTGRVAESAIPTILAGTGGLVGGAVGTALGGPGVGTVAGGAAGGGIGGAYGTRFNQLISQLAGVYDPEGAGEDVAIGGLVGAGGDILGRGVAAAAPIAKEIVSAGSRGSAKTAAKFLGADREALDTGLGIAEQGEQPGAGPFGLSKAGTEVSPSAIFKSSPHVAPNLAETLAQKFDASKPYKTHAELYMDKKAAEILAHKDIGAIVEGSLIHPKAAVSTEKAGVALQESARLHAVGQSAEADRQLAEALAARRAAPMLAKMDDNNFGNISAVAADTRFGETHSRLTLTPEEINVARSHGIEIGDNGVLKNEEMQRILDERDRRISGKPAPQSIEDIRSRKASVEKAAEEAKQAADNLVQQGFRDIEQQANDAIRVAQVGHNAGDLWRTVAESFVNLRRSIGARATQMYTNANVASNGLVPPGGEALAGRAQALLDELPEGFAAQHPTIVRRIAGMAGEVGENGAVVREPTAATWSELHELRTMIRQDIKWNDLPSDVKNGTLKHMQNGIDQILHSVENQPELQEASRLLRLADNFYRENMGPLNDAQIKSLVKALDSGLQADPKALLKVAIKDGKTEVADTIRNTVGPQTWDAMRAADVQDMLASSRQLNGEIDGAQFAKQVLERQRNGVLGTLHGEAGAARLNQQATYIEQLRGKLPIQARPGDTANDIILRARSAVADAENLARADPLKALQNDMKKVEAAARKEGEARRTQLQNTDPTGQQNQALALLNNSTVGANKAVDRILADPDLIVAASRAFPGGEKSSAFQLMRQIWTQRFLSETLEPGEKLAATSPEIQALMFPGVTLEDMHMLAKEMKLLMSGATMHGSNDMGGSIMAQSAVENPFGRASGLGKLAGPMKILPGANFGARAALTAYYNGIRGLMTSPSTLRWLRKGLMSRDPQAKEAARAELRAALQRGGAMGAGGAEAVYQGSGQ